MECIVLCAGFATRLYPLTRNRPKQLLPMGPGCVLDCIMERLSEVGVSSATLVCNHRFFGAFEQWCDRQRSTIALNLLDDGVVTAENRLGAVGDLHLAVEALDIQREFLVLHGDNLFTFSLQPILNAFRQQGNTLATYDVESVARARKAGQVSCGANGRITRIVEKPDHPGSTRVTIGIYAFQKEVRTLIQTYMTAGLTTDRTGDLMAWLCSRIPLYAYPVAPDDGIWFDIGTPQDYQRAAEMISPAQHDVVL